MENCSENKTDQWEFLLHLFTAEEAKTNRTNDSEIETMNYFLNKEGVKEIWHQWLCSMRDKYARKQKVDDTPLKCDAVSLWWRQLGNNKFRTNLMEESYECYSRSVLYAHQDGPKYSLALANRSAVLFRLKRFKECLTNIDMAMSSGYPAELRFKLQLRRAECLIELQKPANAVVALTSAIEESDRLKPSQASEVHQQIEALEKKLDMIPFQMPDEEPVMPDSTNNYKGDNLNFAAASSVIGLSRNETEGRHVVAHEALQRGDVVFSEEPYAWVALPSSGDVCDECWAPHIDLVPCRQCSRVVYCSLECRERAAAMHRWECAGAQAQVFTNIGIAHLALRVLLVSTVMGFPPVPADCPVPTTAADLFRYYEQVDNIDIYKTDTPAFYRMFNLVTNFKKMENVDYTQYAVTATMLTVYLEHFTPYLEDLQLALPRMLPQSELRLFAGAFLFRALGQLVCNGHTALSMDAVERAKGSNSKTVPGREVRRASAIYLSAAMMNHSCDPNIVNTFYKTRLIVKCSREVPAGSQVLNCYGPHYANDTTACRQQLLKEQYMFTCNCTACLDFERREFTLLFNTSTFACPTCKGAMVHSGSWRAVCPQCRTPFDPEKAGKIVDQAEALLADAEQATSKEERIEKTLASLRLKQQVLYRHNSSLRVDADDLARLYADNGEHSKSVELIKQTVQSLEYQHGSFSLEVANELQKLASVMLGRVAVFRDHPDYRDWCLETHKILKKAVHLMELHRGSWVAVTKELKYREELAALLVLDSRASDAPNDDVHNCLHYNLKI